MINRLLQIVKKFLNEFRQDWKEISEKIHADEVKRLADKPTQDAQRLAEKSARNAQRLAEMEARQEADQSARWEQQKTWPIASLDEASERAVKEHWWKIADYAVLGPKTKSVAYGTVHGQWYLDVYKRYGFAEARSLVQLAKNNFDIRKVKDPSEVVKQAAVRKKPANLQYIDEQSETLHLEVVRQIEIFAGNSRSLLDRSGFGASPEEIKEILSPLPHFKNPSEMIQDRLLIALGYLESAGDLECGKEACKPSLQIVLLWNGGGKVRLLENRWASPPKYYGDEYLLEKIPDWSEDSYTKSSYGQTASEKHSKTPAQSRSEMLRHRYEDLPPSHDK